MFMRHRSAFGFGLSVFFVFIRECLRSYCKHGLCGSQDRTAVTAFPVVGRTARCSVWETLTEIFRHQKGAVVARVIVRVGADTVSEGLPVGRERTEVWIVRAVRSARTRWRRLERRIQKRLLGCAEVWRLRLPVSRRERRVLGDVVGRRRSARIACCTRHWC